MNNLLLKLGLFILLTTAPAMAQLQRYTNICSDGAKHATTQGLASTNYLEAAYPACTVTVFNHGTLDAANIFSNSSGTPLGNPFTASSSGIYGFYAATGNLHYDVQMSGVGMTTTTIADVVLGGSGGSGGTCGPLPGDTTSTDCGTSNQVNSTATTVQTFGFRNVNVASGGITGNQIAAVGNSNLFNGTALTTHLTEVYMFGDTNGNNITSGNAMVGGGLGSCFANFGTASASMSNVVCWGDGVGSNGGTPGNFAWQDIVAAGDGSVSQLTGTIHDIVGIGDASASDYVDGTNNVIGIGQLSATGWRNVQPQASVDNLVGIGNNVATFHGTGSSDIGGLGDQVSTRNVENGLDTNSDDIYGVGHNVCNDVGPNTSDVFCFGHDINGTADATLTNAIGIGHSITLASNTTIIGNSSITSLKLFGCPSGQSVLDDGSGTCYVPGTSSFITSLTTTGSSGPATVVSGVLNIPQYSGGGGGTPGGTSGQTQYNNSGSFGGYTPSGDMTVVPSTGVFTIASNAVTTTKINNAAVTLAKIANASANSRLLGSGSAGSGAAYTEITVSGCSFSGTTLTCTGTGNTTSTTLTTNTLPKANGANSIIDSGLSDDGTSLSYAGSGGAHGFTFPEGTALSGVASNDIMWSDSTAHRWKMNNNNGGAVTIASLSDLATSGVFGVVKCDGTTITCASGVISAVPSVVVRGTLTMTVATSDVATITGATGSSVCTAFPTNATAAASTTVAYISAVAANSVTVSHAATVASGGTLNILCTIN